MVASEQMCELGLSTCGTHFGETKLITPPEVRTCTQQSKQGQNVRGNRRRVRTCVAHGCIGIVHISSGPDASACATDGAYERQQMARESTDHKHLVASMTFNPDFTSLSISSTFTSTGTCPRHAVVSAIHSMQHAFAYQCMYYIQRRVLCRWYPPVPFHSAGHRAGPLHIFEPLEVKTPMARTA